MHDRATRNGRREGARGFQAGQAESIAHGLRCPHGAIETTGLEPRGAGPRRGHQYATRRDARFSIGSFRPVRAQADRASYKGSASDQARAGRPTWSTAGCRARSAAVHHRSPSRWLNLSGDRGASRGRRGSRSTRRETVAYQHSEAARSTERNPRYGSKTAGRRKLAGFRVGVEAVMVRMLCVHDPSEL